MQLIIIFRIVLKDTVILTYHETTKPKQNVVHTQVVLSSTKQITHDITSYWTMKENVSG